jgi:hypothetical protein
VPLPRLLLARRAHRGALAVALATLAAACSDTTTAEPTSLPTCAIACCDRACADGVAPDFLIVTRPLFVDALQRFVRFKRDEGRSVGLVTLDAIHAAAGGASGVSLATELKRTLAAYHARGTRFALLVGDARVTPPADPYAPQSPGAHAEMDTLASPWSVPTGYYYRDLPGETYPGEEYTDVFFADLADWDPDGDGVNDAIDSVQTDLGAMLFVGRWPVRTVAEVAAITGKTLDVAARAAKGELPRRQVALASVEFGATDDLPASCAAPYRTSDPLSWWIDKSNCERDLPAARAALERAGFVSEFHAFSIAAPTDAEKSTFDRLFGRPDAMVAVSFHGSHDFLATPSGSSTTNIHFETTFPLLTTTACLVGTFELGDDDALDEALLKAVPGPAIVAQPEYVRAFYEHLAAGRSIGEAFYASKLMDPGIAEGWRRNAGMWLGSGNGLTLQATDVLLGDPSLVLYPSR